MSASLVGSEMCIRDRPHPASTCACCCRRAEASRPPPLAKRAKPPAGAPVSYTHLTLPTICSV
eukprot:5631632-Alexandrium_andersonii.AAC.1